MGCPPLLPFGWGFDMSLIMGRGAYIKLLVLHGDEKGGQAAREYAREGAGCNAAVLLIWAKAIAAAADCVDRMVCVCVVAQVWKADEGRWCGLVRLRICG